MAVGKDKWANVAANITYQTVANNDVYGTFSFPISIQDKVGIIIHRLEYWPLALQQLDATTDYWLGGISCSNGVNDLTDMRDPLIVDAVHVTRFDLGAAATGLFYTKPYIKDFAALPNGGVLVAPNPLYSFVSTSGAGAVMGIMVRIFYTYMELKNEEFWELVESRRIVT